MDAWVHARMAGRDVTEDLGKQTHARMAAPAQRERVAALVDKYAAPVREYADDWDTALLNVYRAELAAREDAAVLGGRRLLRAARALGSNVAFCVITGDDDRVVPVRASRRVAALLGLGEREGGGEGGGAGGGGAREMAATGHLPMDEKPEALAEALLPFLLADT